MALKITLKPGERMIIGGAVITNGDKPTEFVIENRVPVLRQKDVMNEDEADSPCRRIYFAIQLMYVDPANLSEYWRLFLQLAREIGIAAPSTMPLLDGIGEDIASARYYRALKKTKILINYEKELTENVRKSA
ncbi:flagellar biosynthesis repressor FlbT [Desulfococcus sp.]|uniref:flagellar biosynthesis repressor FlbT n=1 Tax=Desulfococcus sp. TaxID=2025834 RepID=UPI00359382D2